MAAVRLGLDIGTTAIKAAAYDPEGRLLARAERVSRTITQSGGKSEQDMQAVWQGVTDTLRSLTDALGDATITSLGLCGQGDGLWLTDSAGAPLGNAVLWNDTRAARDVSALNDSGASDSVALACHTALWPGTSGPIWRWIERHEPERAARAAHALTCADWVGYRLTGQIATDFSNASIPFLNFASRACDDAALTALGCEGLRPLLSAPRRADSLLGTLMPEVARITGLPAGLPVCVGTLDLAAMIVGMGLRDPGESMLIMGTTAVVNILTDHVTPTNRPVGASALHPTSGAIIRIFAPTTGTGAFDWFAGLHPLSLGGANTAEVADKLNALVHDVPPGANGVTFLPYLNGERAPFVAPELTAGFYGLTARSTKADMGRAVMEGTALSLRHCLDAEGRTNERQGIGGPVKLAGGGSRNPVWAQIIADVVDTPIAVAKSSDHGLWGAACLGAAAAGEGDAITLAARAEDLIHFAPSPEHAAQYGPVFRRYKHLSHAARAVARSIAESEDYP